MTREHDRYREMAAAYVLGALDPEERADFEAHLSECDRCRDEVVELAPLPALLGRLDPEDVEGPGAGGTVPSADAVVAAVRADVEHVRRSRRRWRVAAVAAAVVALMLGGALAVTGLGDDGGDGGGPFGNGVALGVRSTSGATGQVFASEHSWGTYVYVSVTGLPERDGYELWVVDQDGGWHAAGSWSPTNDGAAELGGSCRLQLDEIDRVVVTAEGRSGELLVAR